MRIKPRFRAAILLCALFITSPPLPLHAEPPSTQNTSRVTLPNVSFFQNWNAQMFDVGIDESTLRPSGSGSPAVLLESDTKEWGKGGVALRGLDLDLYRGKRIRFSAYLKCENLANWASLRLIAMGPENRILLHDELADMPPLVKTTDWTLRQIVADVPPETTSLRVGSNLYGAGKLWMDGATVEIVDKTVPTTDDQNYHAWSFSLPLYSATLDENNKRDGHPTRLLQSVSPKVINGYWLAWDNNDRHPERFFGKKVRLSAWIKSEGVTAPSGLTFRILGPAFTQINANAAKTVMTVRGTTNWKKYEATAEIPPECQCIGFGVRLCGKGKLWVDDIQYEAVEP